LRLFGIGQTIGLTLLTDNDIFCQQPVVLENPKSTLAEMVAAEKSLWFISTKPNQQILSIPSDFQDLRKTLQRTQLLVTLNLFHLPEQLENYHSIRVFYGVQERKGHKLDSLK